MRKEYTLTLLVGLMLVSSVEGQNKRMGTAAASELLIPVGGRDLAIGGASIATSKGAEAIFWNPAGLGRLEHSAEGMFSTMSYLADIKVNYGAVGAAFGDFGVVGFTIKALNFGDIPLTTNDDPEGRSGRLFTPAFVTVGLTYARALTDAISTGATFKMIVEHIDQVSATGVAVDVGVQYRNLGGVPGLHFGVSVKNIGPQMKFDGPGLLGPAKRSDGQRPEQKYQSEAASFELPSLFEVGLSYDSKASDNITWGVSSSFTNKNLGLDEFRLGGEVGYALETVQLFGRLGTDMIPTAIKDEQRIFGTSFGIGVVYNASGIDITLDYAYRAVQYFDPNSVISLKFGF